MKNEYKIAVGCYLIFLLFDFNNKYERNLAAEIKTSSILDFFSIQQDSLIADGATLQLVSKQFSFTEGPSVDKKGNIFFTDQPNDKIWKYDTEGNLSVFLDKAKRPNGTYFDSKGNLLTCAEEKDEILSIDKKGEIKILLKDYLGHRLNGPNDLWADKKGNIYFTDPYFQRSFWDRKSPDIKGEKVYYLPKGKDQPIPVIEDMLQPNGIVGTPDGKYLYVADMKGRKTYRYLINKNGSLSDKQLILQQGSDGMTLDENGNIYVTGNGGVTAYNKEGIKLLFIRVPSGWTSNVCFGGKDRKTLFITASESVYT
ncbi:MAG: SMP-30/gluconolactonase/LRE family protein, partial [Bacteroidia bacterium]|nr:SMP-30/gluconolactonase/LRE family protein [Bacteroidia bacterium]